MKFYCCLRVGWPKSRGMSQRRSLGNLTQRTDEERWYIQPFLANTIFCKKTTMIYPGLGWWCSCRWQVGGLIYENAVQLGPHGHSTGTTRERLRKELPDSKVLEVKIFLRNHSNCAIAFVQARTVCMQDSLPSGFKDQCLAQGNNFATSHFLESRLSGSLFCGSTFCRPQRGGSQKHGPYLGKV